VSFDLVKLGLRALLVLPVCSLLSSGGGAQANRPLYAVGAPAPLASGYGLGVVELPEPPAPVKPAAQADERRCPVEIRAIVAADDPSDSFAVLAWGGKSAVVNERQSERTSAGWLRVTKIRPDHVVLRRGEVTFHCPLGTGGRRPDRAR
jgi:hypothetical protein